MDTELGKIANLSQQTQTQYTPLQKELSNIAKKLSLGTVILGIVLLAIALLADFSTREAFIFAI